MRLLSNNLTYAPTLSVRCAVRTLLNYYKIIIKKAFEDDRPHYKLIIKATFGEAVGRLEF